MKKTHILVFGAAGFIATYLIDELLRTGYEVTASDINEIPSDFCKAAGIDYIQVDITKKEDFERLGGKQFDTVIHLASCQPANVAGAHYDPRDYITVNVIGTLNILDYCHKNQSNKIIYASSHRNTQGLWAADRAISEDNGRAIKYTGEYTMFSISETAAQDCVTHYQEQYGLQGIIFRLPPFTGMDHTREYSKMAAPLKLASRYLLKKQWRVSLLRSGAMRIVGRDIIYVKDVVSAFIKAIENKSASGLYNITSGQYLTLHSQAEAIAKLFWGSDETPIIVETPEKPNEMDAFLYDISKAKKDLGWTPIYTFEKMLLDYKKSLKARNLST